MTDKTARSPKAMSKLENGTEGRRGAKPRAPSGAELVAEAMVRGSVALRRAVLTIPRTTLYELVRDPHEEKILLAAVLQPTVLETLSAPLLKAKLPGVERKRELLVAEGGTISAEEAGDLLGISRQAVDKARRAGRLLALNIRRAWRYPLWQFPDATILPGLREVLGSLRTMSPWVRAAFLLDRNAHLGNRRPLDLLKQAKVAEVIDVARAHGQQGVV